MINFQLSTPLKKTKHHKQKNRSHIWGLLTNHCPHCREGKIFLKENAYGFKDNLKMHESCPVCKQPTETEIGIYYGTGYVSYFIAVVLSGFTFIAWWIFFGISADDNRILYWLAINSGLIIILQPLLMRFSRTLWLSWFVRYEDDWKEN